MGQPLNAIEMDLCTSGARLVDLCLDERADTSRVHKLIESGANVNYILKRKEKGPRFISTISTTELCSAATKSRIDIVSAFLDFGANPILKDGMVEPRTPLHQAVDFPDIVSLLLESNSVHLNFNRRKPPS